MTDADAVLTASLLDLRSRKDAQFASGHGPIRGAALESFTGLSYYPPDPALVFRLPLEAEGGGQEVTLQTSIGEPRQMRAFGTVRVPFVGGDARLILYVQSDLEPGDETPGSLFLPFRDGASGTESYGAGRYLDVPTARQDGQTWVNLDFNLAYHPYCAYGDGWVCPLPPAGNWLAFPVRAGERLP
ncbi:DUF1684 domain-containing protein [Deinococcus sp.]|uniref:DUF1684 domain-containing protein n=1 Tax=Deinococcus sp. TaxID=47478 RepID=UPI003C7E2807